MQENTDQNSSEHGHFLRSEDIIHIAQNSEMRKMIFKNFKLNANKKSVFCEKKKKHEVTSSFFHHDVLCMATICKPMDNLADNYPVNPSRSDIGRGEKVSLNFYFHISLWYLL